MKSYFPIFKNIPDLIYLDNAATTQKPKQVIDAIKYFYEWQNANIHRGMHFLSEIATNEYEKTRAIIASFINAKKPQEIIFTRNTTEALNMVAKILSSILKKDDIILLTEMEHHSNIIPWIMISQEIGCKIKYIPLSDNKNLDLPDTDEKWDKLFTNVKIFSFVHVSNSLGTINDAKNIILQAKKRNIITILDCAQSISHMKLDMQDLNCDFATFSIHKMYGPFGVGILYGKYELLKKLPPFLGGGDMVLEVKKDFFNTAELPSKYEAGTQNIEGVIAAKSAIEFLQDISFEKINSIEKKVFKYAYEKLLELDFVDMVSPIENNVGIISFNIKNIHPHDVNDILNEKKICIRVGHHCTQLVMQRYNLIATNRLSIGIYNDTNDIDILVNTLKQVYKKFN